MASRDSQASSATLGAPEIPWQGGVTCWGHRSLSSFRLGHCQAFLGAPAMPLLSWAPFTALSALSPPSRPGLPPLSGSNATLRKTLYVFQINAIKSIKVCERSSFSFSFYLIREIPTAQFLQMKPRPEAHCSGVVMRMCYLSISHTNVFSVTVPPGRRRKDLEP